MVSLCGLPAVIRILPQLATGQKRYHKTESLIFEALRFPLGCFFTAPVFYSSVGFEGSSSVSKPSVKAVEEAAPISRPSIRSMNCAPVMVSLASR